ncbi:MAG: hypothetical protein J7M19_09155 [Planctomycetes bacterium]|nr:hypothetical protein [Planctomycetota bacterium]
MSAEKDLSRRGGFELPVVDLSHFVRLTDGTGILQHANYTVADYREGYATDDNARALIVATMAQNAGVRDDRLDDLAARYLAFLRLAFNSETSRFRNFFGYEREWQEHVGSEDSHGRTIWALGTAAAYAGEEGQRSTARELVLRGLPAVEGFSSPRAWAFAILGVYHYLRALESDDFTEGTMRVLAHKLAECHSKIATPEWPWFEESLAYANAKLPHALLAAGEALGDESMTRTGLETLSWLAEVQTTDDGHFGPVGSNGFYAKDGEMARFDQQPIEAHATVSACIAAYRVTRQPKWLEHARAAFEWFLGRNDLGVPLYDSGTGGCRDGLHPDRANENQGAESTLAWLLSLIEMRTAADLFSKGAK